MTLKHRRRSSTKSADFNSPPKSLANEKDDSNARTQQLFNEILNEKNKRLQDECLHHRSSKFNAKDYVEFRERSSIWLSIVSIPLFGLFLYALLYYLLFFDLNKRVYNHVPGECSYLPGAERGVVDLHLVNNVTLIASTGTDLNNATNSTGGILLWRLNEHESRLFELRNAKGKTISLNPLGLSFARGTVVVVNLRRPIKQTDTVELLRIEGEMLKRVTKPVKSPIFTSLCDVQALDSQNFYATNSYYSRRTSLQFLEFSFKTKTASLIYFDGQKVNKVLDGLIASACGLALQGRELYISIPAADQIIIHTIGKTPMDLKLKETISVFSAPYFFHLGPSPLEFVVATHPNKMRHLLQRYWPYEYFAPSQVLRFGRTRKGDWRITQYYANDGATISSASVAIQLPDQRLLIGSTKDGLLKCALTSI